MSQLPWAREGESLEINGDKPPFSLWLVAGAPKPKLQYRIFSADPWPVIADAIEHRCPKNLKEVAFAFQDQAEDFYQSALDGRIHAKPLLIYYGMLNLAKSLILTENIAPKDYRPHHGLSEDAKLREIQGAIVKVTGPRTIGPKGKQKTVPPLFSDFARAIVGSS